MSYDFIPVENHIAKATIADPNSARRALGKSLWVDGIIYTSDGENWDTTSVGTQTYANLPPANAVPAGTTFYVSDYNSMAISNGVEWKFEPFKMSYADMLNVPVDFLSEGTKCQVSDKGYQDWVYFNAMWKPESSVANTKTLTATSNTLVAGDDGLVIEVNNASANTLTIPANTFIVGTVIGVRQMGAGTTTLVAESGVTIRNPHGTLKLAQQYAMVFLHQRTLNEWCVEGNFAEA